MGGSHYHNSQLGRCLREGESDAHWGNRHTPQPWGYLWECLFAAFFNQNGWGEMTGIAPLQEEGRLKTPIFLTGTYTVGVLVMSNTATREHLRVDGVPMGREMQEWDRNVPGGSKSIIFITATDAPLFNFQLKKIAKRVAMGLAQTGAISNTSSGALVLAFSTSNVINNTEEGPLTYRFQWIEERNLSPFFSAGKEVIKEAVANSLLMATPVEGRMDREGAPIPLELLKQRFFEQGL